MIKKINILILIKDHPTILFNNLISPNKLIGGGAAILHNLNKNNHKAILSIKFSKPLLINNLKYRTLIGFRCSSTDTSLQV